MLRALRQFPSLLPLPAPAILPQLTPVATSRIWVVCAYFNPCNYENRRANYMQFAARLQSQNVPLCTVEMATAQTKLQLALAKHDMYVPIISPDVLWAKECLLNIGIRALPPACDMVVWADADLAWKEDDWATQTIQALTNPKTVVVQPFEFAANMREGERYETHYADKPPTGGTALPIGKAYVQRPDSFMATQDIYRAHAGYAWAARRDILERINGLYEYCVLGHADYVMAVAFSHSVARDGPMGDAWSEGSSFNWGPELLAHARAWQIAAANVVQGRLGYVPGVSVFHSWHGDPRDRQYRSRGRLIANYNPKSDIVRLRNGALAWSPAAVARGLPLRVQQYFEKRKEDGQTAEVRAQRDREDALIALWRRA